VPTVLLVRHGRSTANTSGVLAGWTSGVHLDDLGREQAATLAQRLAAVPIAAAVSSPLERCQQTAAALLSVPGPDGQHRPPLSTDSELGECRYGDWTGQKIADLVKDPLWRVVQAHPSAVTFPGDHGESMLAMQQRAVGAIRRMDAAVAAEHGDHAVWLAVSHGDVIKSILADALGMHLDAFQRLVVDPCSVSVIRYTTLRPFAVRINDSGTDLGTLIPPPPAAAEAADSGSHSGSNAGLSTGADPDQGMDPSDALVGGSAGPARTS
jgi:probable phosphomutase (TIGR03848 family)